MCCLVISVDNQILTKLDSLVRLTGPVPDWVHHLKYSWKKRGEPSWNYNKRSENQAEEVPAIVAVFLPPLLLFLFFFFLLATLFQHVLPTTWLGLFSLSFFVVFLMRKWFHKFHKRGRERGLGQGEEGVGRPLWGVFARWCYFKTLATRRGVEGADNKGEPEVEPREVTAPTTIVSAIPIYPSPFPVPIPFPLPRSRSLFTVFPLRLPAMLSQLSGVSTLEIERVCDVFISLEQKKGRVGGCRRH